MSILMLACMVFPMLEYSESRITFEHNLLESLGVELVIWQEEHPYFVFAFSDEEYEQIIRKPVNVNDVNKFAETRPQGYEIILGLTVWQNYIKERKEESEKYRKYLLGEIFGDDQQLSPELLPEPVPPPQKKSAYQLEKEKHRRAIYQEVTNEMGVSTKKGILVEEAAKRAECSEKMIREALKAGK
ncbi:hypothetical protein [Thiothrix subterranea]|uniref:Uncharacterized protein n=1 Tax=Thiothrix subterranea TaxID=2735563 RepID=A0AA51MKB9_9GAMM|nr:hypothetical protein [Thiothrix subterranea]MDQ5771004.1 hypothetical protein [Thiothrix subterranea]WML85788.1 hypothetical protein RCG00_15965 [Thiothrix subterranea]